MKMTHQDFIDTSATDAEIKNEKNFEKLQASIDKAIGKAAVKRNITTTEKVLLGIGAVATVVVGYKVATGTGGEAWNGIKKGAAMGGAAGCLAGTAFGCAAAANLDKVYAESVKRHPQLPPKLGVGGKVGFVAGVAIVGIGAGALFGGMVGGALSGIGSDPDFAGNGIEFSNTVGG
jgi:hypothetical protein